MAWRALAGISTRKIAMYGKIMGKIMGECCFTMGVKW